jgi:hypothetical protein
LQNDMMDTIYGLEYLRKKHSSTDVISVTQRGSFANQVQNKSARP